jgi:hypothetical protein
MDGERFDAFVKKLSASAPRRVALRFAGAGALASLLGAHLAEPAGAAVKCKKAACPTACPNAVAPGGGPCACASTVSGNKVCIAKFCGKGCNRNKDCGKGQVCSDSVKKCGRCDSNKKGRCVTPCNPVA